MSKVNEAHLTTEEADTEVELSAQDLLDLSGLPSLPSPKPLQPSPPPSDESHARGGDIDARRGSSGRLPIRLTLPLSLLVTVGVIGGTYLFTTSSHTSPARAANSTQPVPSPPSLAPTPEHMPAGKPVLFANPFDANEVFEFPAGTSRTEARDAVAKLLTERAMSRQET